MRGCRAPAKWEPAWAIRGLPQWLRLPVDPIEVQDRRLGYGTREVIHGISFDI